MVVALNILLPVIVIGILYAGYKMKKMLLSIVLAVLVSVLYGFIQPSYMPKGTVKPMPIAEFKGSDKKIEDRMKKPESGEQRDAKMKASQEETTKRINELQKELKEEKKNG